MCARLLSIALGYTCEWGVRGISEPTRIVVRILALKHLPLISANKKVDMYPVLLREERLSTVDALTVM